MKQLSKKLYKKSKKILFIGHSKKKTKLIKYIADLGHEVWWENKKIKQIKNFDMVISFGYRHILSKEILQNKKCKFINLHLSYLPYNRGAHPNFWSFYDNTPSGVTIHEINHKIDKGDIIIQKYVNFTNNENTFKLTYNRLFNELENLFIYNSKKIIDEKYKKTKQRGIGTFHNKKDIPESFKGWDSKIFSEIKRLEKIIIKNKNYKLSLIDKIEKVRTANNVNWMDILRLLFKDSPNEAKKLIKKINLDDNRITNLFEELSK